MDDWLIGDLRRHARPLSTNGLLLEESGLQQVACRLDTAERELGELRLRLQRAERRLDGVSVHHAVAHTRFVQGPDGYEIVEATGPPPRAGETVIVGERRYRTVRIGRSPFPLDRRPCAYVEPA